MVTQPGHLYGVVGSEELEGARSFFDGALTDAAKAHYTKDPKSLARFVAARDGTLTAIHFRNVSNTGAYGNHGGETAFAGASAVAIYRCPNKKFDAYAVYTNTVPSGALRGYGMTQPVFAVESAMHELAVALGIDPLELRRRNIIRPGEPLLSIHVEADDVEFTQDTLATCIDHVDGALRSQPNEQPLGEEVVDLVRIAGHVDRVTLPDDSELPPATADFRELFARPAQLSQWARLQQLGLNTDSALERSLGERIVISLEAPEGLWRVMADRSQFENALVNLALDQAREANRL